MNPLVQALTGFFPQLLPEAVLGLAACVFFLGGTWRARRRLWGVSALVSLGLAGVLLVYTATATQIPTVEALRERMAEAERRSKTDPTPEGRQSSAESLTADASSLRASVYASPVLHTQLAVLIAAIALVGGAVLVLLSWNDVPDA